MPVIEVSSVLRSGFSCAIGVLAGTIEAIFQGFGHIVGRGRVFE